MLDRNGIHVQPRATVRFYYFNRWRKGTVRDVVVDRVKKAEVAKVDDGAPEDADIRTNNFRVAAFVASDDLEVVHDG